MSSRPPVRDPRGPRPAARGVRARVVGRPRDNTHVPLIRLAWVATVVACALTALLLILSGYVGYGFVAVAVGLSAAINIR